MNIKARWMQKRALKEERVKKYLENPEFCPFCKSDNIKADDVEVGVSSGYRNINCFDCDRGWSENWRMVSIDLDDDELSKVEKSEEETKRWEQRWHKR